MSGYLLDTNVVSELTRAAPDKGVVAFLSENEDFWLSTILIHEIEYGVRLLPQGRRRERLTEMLAAVVRIYEDRILPLDRLGAEWSAELRARARKAGRNLDLGDALVAGTAKAHSLAVVTRNDRHFDDLGVDTVNPWKTP
ncbi:MAG: type II toxin-antitoxin system VapC family toxin [Gemmatimonadetes bacterium]|nr:type II toxin-antitoxin system VapC family toxin [Gemmatimonadota bacterium]